MMNFERSPYAPAPLHDELPEDEQDPFLDRGDTSDELDFNDDGFDWFDEEFAEDDWEDDDEYELDP